MKALPPNHFFLFIVSTIPSACWPRHLSPSWCHQIIVKASCPPPHWTLSGPPCSLPLEHLILLFHTSVYIRWALCLLVQLAHPLRSWHQTPLKNGTSVPRRTLSIWIRYKWYCDLGGQCVSYSSGFLFLSLNPTSGTLCYVGSKILSNLTFLSSSSKPLLWSYLAPYVPPSVNDSISSASLSSKVSLIYLVSGI